MWAADLADAHARVGDGDRADAVLALLQEQALYAELAQALAGVERAYVRLGEFGPHE